MKTKIIKVVIEREIMVSIPDECLTEDYLKDFSSYMFDVENEDDLFKYAATQLFDNQDQYIEGLGEAKWKGTHKEIKSDDVLYEQVDSNIECEIIEQRGKS